MDMPNLNIRRKLVVFFCVIMISYVGEASHNDTERMAFCRAYPCKEKYICDTGLDMCVSCERYCHKRVSDECATKCKEHTGPKILPEVQTSNSSKHSNNDKPDKTSKHNSAKAKLYAVIFVSIFILILIVYIVGLILYAKQIYKIYLLCSKRFFRNGSGNINSNEEGGACFQENGRSLCVNSDDGTTNNISGDLKHDSLDGDSVLSHKDETLKSDTCSNASSQNLRSPNSNVNEEYTLNDSEDTHLIPTHVPSVPKSVDVTANDDSYDLSKDDTLNRGRFASYTSDASYAITSILDQQSGLSNVSWVRTSLKSSMSVHLNAHISRVDGLSSHTNVQMLSSCDETRLQTPKRMNMHSDLLDMLNIQNDYAFNETGLKFPDSQMSANSVLHCDMLPILNDVNMACKDDNKEALPRSPAADEDTPNQHFQNTTENIASSFDKPILTQSDPYVGKHDFKPGVHNEREKKPIQSISNLDSSISEDVVDGPLFLSKNTVRAAGAIFTITPSATPPELQRNQSNFASDHVSRGIDSIGIGMAVQSDPDDHHSSNINIYASASELMVGQPVEGNHYDGNDSISDHSFNINLSLNENHENQLLICQPSDAVHDPNYLSHIEYDEEIEGAVGGRYLPNNQPVHDNDTNSDVSYIPRSITDDSAMASMYDPAYMNRDGFHLAHMDNNPIYEQLQGIPWVMGYHSEGRSISVYADLDIYDVNTLQQQLIETTGQPAEKFKLRQNAQV